MSRTRGGGAISSEKLRLLKSVFKFSPSTNGMPCMRRSNGLLATLSAASLQFLLSLSFPTCPRPPGSDHQRGHSAEYPLYRLLHLTRNGVQSIRKSSEYKPLRFPHKGCNLIGLLLKATLSRSRIWVEGASEKRSFEDSALLRRRLRALLYIPLQRVL